MTNGRRAAVAQMAAWSKAGIHTLPNSGTPAASVKGHCVGAVGRAFLGRAAGFTDATQWARRAKAAGILHTGSPGFGDIVLWTGGSNDYGHVGIATGPALFWGVDKPVVNEIGLSPIAKVWSSLAYAGFVRPEDMYRLGWPVIPADPPVAVPAAPKPPAYVGYPGKPIGWPGRYTVSSGAPVALMQWCLGVTVTGEYNAATRNAVVAYALLHPKAGIGSLLGPGAIGPGLWASLLTKYHR